MKNRIVSISLAVALILSVGLIVCEGQEVPEIIEYNLTISSTVGGSVVTPGEGIFTYDEGEAVNLVAEADQGYQFVSWTGDVDDIANVEDATTTITMHGDYEIIANFEVIAPIQYSLTISSSSGGLVTIPGQGTFSYDEGEAVNLVATPSGGYRFINWTGNVGTVANVNATQTTFTMPAQNVTVTANFLPDTEGIEPIIFALNKEYADKLPDWENEADEVVDAINFVFAKNTLQQFEISKYLVYNDNEYGALFANPEEYPEYYQDVGHRGGITYILLVHPDGFCDTELYGSDTVNCAYTVYKDGKRYPTLLQANHESWNVLLDEERSSLIMMPVHEIGHYMGLAVPDWYFYEYSDCTGVEPLFDDYSINEDPNFSNDPMTGQYKDENVMEFCELNAAIINRNLDFAYTYDDVRLNWFSKITKVFVTDSAGTPISNATVEIYCVKLGCFFCTTECSAVTYGHAVPTTSVPEQTLLTDNNGYAIYDGPVGAWEMNESQDTPCIAKAIKVYHNGQSATKVVKFMDLQMSYVLNNSNEHITHIVLK